MSYTFLDQKNKLASLLGDANTDTDSQWPLASRVKEINRGEVHFARDTNILREYATGTVADGEIDVPSDWIETYVLMIGDYLVTGKDEISIFDIERYDSGQFPPKYYMWEFSGTRKMKFVGTVNGETYKLWYFKKPTTELSDDTDVSLLPEEYREASVYYAAAELLDQIGNHEIADLHRRSYSNLAEKAISDVEKQYIKRDVPSPDLGEDTASEIDHQGDGF